MKTMLQQSARLFLRSVIPALAAGFVLSAAAHATPPPESDRVTLSLEGVKLKDGARIVEKSDSSIKASTEYRYNLRATVSAPKGSKLAKILPPGTSLEDLLEELDPGSSVFLKGKVANPGGDLPLKLFDETISGKVNVPKFTKVRVSLRILARIDGDGVCKLVIKDVTVRPKAKKVGYIIFEEGSKLVVKATGDVDDASSEIGFRFKGVGVSESDGEVVVIVRRTGDLSKKATVKFGTEEGSADTDDFTAASGKLVFQLGENEAEIAIEILDNDDVDDKRFFTIVLSDPTGGAELTEGREELRVVILDDD